MPYKHSLFNHRIVKPLELEGKHIAQIKQLRYRLWSHPQEAYVIQDGEERRLVLALISYWLRQFKHPRLTARK